MDFQLKRSECEILELFFELKSKEDVANILEVDIKTLIYIIYRTEDSKKYKEFTIKKKDGTDRVIKAPNESLKIIQMKLNNIFQLVYMEKGKQNAHGFINGRSILTNAEPHVGKKQVFNVDLKDFFPSINFGRVRGMFIKTFQIGTEAATVLAQISCYENALPQGSPCSPIISNLICRQLDRNLFLLAKKYGCTYTRYADDITFSCNKKLISNEIGFNDVDGEPYVGIKLKKIIKDNGFNINEKKVVLSNQFEHQEVTGLVVNKKVNVRYSYIKNLRSMLYKTRNKGIYNAAIQYIDKYAKNVPMAVLKDKSDQEKNKTIENWFLSVIKGKLLYLKMIRGNEDSIFLKYASMYNEITDEEFFEVEKYNDVKSWLKKRIVVIDPKSYSRGSGTGFYAKGYGLVTCYHVIEDEELFYHAKNPFTGDVSALQYENFVKDDKLDVAIYKCKDMEYSFEVEENPNYDIGQTIKLAGYPQYKDGNDLDIRECKIASTTNYMGQKLYLIDGDIFHGASGGPVFNIQNKVIGIIRAGIESLGSDDARSNMNRGFIPIKVIDALEIG